MDAVYERHRYDFYKNKQVPFLFHQDKLAGKHFLGTRMHWHENPEFLCGISGRGKVIADGNGVGLQKGTVVAVNSNVAHAFFNYGEEPLIYNCLIVDVEFCRQNGIDPDAVQFDSCAEDEALTALYEAAFTACNTAGEFYAVRARSAVLNFLLYMCQRYGAERGSVPCSASGIRIKEAVRFIREHFAEPLTLRQAAVAAGFSTCYFSREFKRLTGQTFVSFVNLVRCEEAAKLMEKGVTATQACYACGFRDLGYFSRTFKKRMGRMPSEVRIQKKQTPAGNTP